MKCKVYEREDGTFLPLPNSITSNYKEIDVTEDEWIHILNICQNYKLTQQFIKQKINGE